MNFVVKAWICIFMGALLLYSCKPGERTAIDIKHDEVMAIKDEFMPRMSDIYNLKKRLKKMENSKSEIVVSAIEDLEKADDAMMDWMADYKKPKESDTNAMEYLEEEMIKVKSVKALMLAAIENAQKILGND